MKQNVEHSGAADSAYRARRQSIVGLVEKYYESRETIQAVNYTREENEIWKTVLRELAPLHKKYASRVYLDGLRRLALPSDAIPELADVSRRLEGLCGFRLVPVGGLMDARIFLSNLRGRRMLCTQYVRHPARPLYSPDPDVIHEIIGHAPFFTNRRMVEIYELIGTLAHRASEEQLVAVERLAWFTIETGLIREGGRVKVIGTALLSSPEEIEHCLSDEVEKSDFSMEEVVATPFDTSRMQPKLFVIPSLRELKKEMRRYFRPLGLI